MPCTARRGRRSLRVDITYIQNRKIKLVVLSLMRELTQRVQLGSMFLSKWLPWCVQLGTMMCATEVTHLVRSGVGAGNYLDDEPPDCCLEVEEVLEGCHHLMAPLQQSVFSFSWTCSGGRSRYVLHAYACIQ